MTDSTFRLPDLGEGLQEAEIVAWHVSVGDHVVADQPLVSVETDKAVVEVPAPEAGRIAKLYGAPGERVPVGAPLVAFGEGEHEDPGGIVGELTEPAAAKAEGTAAPAPGHAKRSPGRSRGETKVKALPAVRALAKSLGVDLSTVEPTGPNGEIIRADVEAAAGAGSTAASEPLRGVRRAMAEAMTAAHAEVMRATVTDEADVEGWAAGTNATVRLILAIVAACRAEPALNAWYDSKATARRLHEAIDLGLAVDTDEGLFVPVLRDAGNRDADALAEAVADIKARAAARKVARDELRGATISLSNFGPLGGRFANLVVVPPQVAIVGAGSIAPRAVARDGAPQVRRLLPLSLTFDHRAVTGGEAARFLAALKADLERP